MLEEKRHGVRRVGSQGVESQGDGESSGKSEGGGSGRLGSHGISQGVGWESGEYGVGGGEGEGKILYVVITSIMLELILFLIYTIHCLALAPTSSLWLTLR